MGQFVELVNQSKKGKRKDEYGRCKIYIHCVKNKIGFIPTSWKAKLGISLPLLILNFQERILCAQAQHNLSKYKELVNS